MVGELNKAGFGVNWLGAVCLAVVAVNGLRTGGGLMERCCNAEGVCVCVSLMAAERMIMPSAVSSTYWLNKVSVCQRPSRFLSQLHLP